MSDYRAELALLDSDQGKSTSIIDGDAENDVFANMFDAAVKSGPRKRVAVAKTFETTDPCMLTAHIVKGSGTVQKWAAIRQS